MNITQFKKMLALHGADINRWDGTDIAAVKELIRSSDQARALYDEAQALDNALDMFEAGAPDPALLENVMARLGGEQKKSQPLPPVRPAAEEKPAPQAGWGRNMQPYWFGAVACAVALLVFIGTLGDHGQDASGGGTAMTAPSVQTAMMHTPEAQRAVAAGARTENIDLFLAELGGIVEEEIAEYEIIGLLAAAETAAPELQPRSKNAHKPIAEQDIDAFLEQLFTDMEEDPALQQEMDLWELFLQSETQEL